MNISKYSNEKNYSPDGSENPSHFCEDCNGQQENELLKMPKISLLKKEIAIGTFFVIATKVNNYAQYKKGNINLCN